MIESATRLTLFTLYQLTVAFGIVMLPVAITLQKFGVTVPIRNAIEATETAYENATQK
ncbi:hypothetical protein [Natronocalculus amylovorans]|uniref:Uncharacterized protein n=1 Tax=Natronocalculus amylovorans TaxID=2917812 RepID=A0AAE3K8D0_9EURY|nr:hypothetical protein [Natronocalculus amylovorans]MCL9816898.1 hypothetical protein [Natronocalculus amylovorans]NUE03041.1 hypothetical protein [Halorubraceae archaeon YAN]